MISLLVGVVCFLAFAAIIAGYVFWSDANDDPNNPWVAGVAITLLMVVYYIGEKAMESL